MLNVLTHFSVQAKSSRLCRKHGVSDTSFYTWRAKFGGMVVSEAVAEGTGRPRTHA